MKLNQTQNQNCWTKGKRATKNTMYTYFLSESKQIFSYKFLGLIIHACPLTDIDKP